ncbi:MAG: hypothetical protein V4450_01600 [Bacteroidota bacterium]
MKSILLILGLLTGISIRAQQNATGPVAARYEADAKFLQYPPVFPHGKDSLQRFYFTHFNGFDSLLAKAIAHGDTGRYIRVYFSFVINEWGTAYDAQFDKIASTQYSKSRMAKTIPHFLDDKKYYGEVIKKMIAQMPFWKPGLVPVGNAGTMVTGLVRITEFMQFWIGIDPPAK